MHTPLFKGATRPPTYLGIPLKPFFYAFMPIAILAILIKIWLFSAILPIYFIMRALVKKDDKYFTELGAKFMLLKKRHKINPKNLYNGLRSYTPFNFPKDRYLSAKLAIQKDGLDEIPLQNYIPYTHHITENIIKTNNNEYIATIEMQGKSFYTIDAVDVVEWKNSLNNHIKTIASTVPDISFWSHVIREKSSVKLHANYKNEFCKSLNQKYLEKFENIYVNRLFLTVVIKKINSNEETIQALNDIISQLITSLSAYKPSILNNYTYNDNLYSKQLEFYSYLISKG